MSMIPIPSSTSDKVSELHDHINGIEDSITFTKEPATGDGSVPFLDTKCIPQPDGTIHTVVYRKPTHTDLYVQWDSNHPLSAKVSVVSSLYHRASTVCRNEQDLKSEYDYLEKVLSYNGYPKWAIDKGKNRCDRQLHRQSQGTSSNVDRSVKNKSFVVLPYIKGVSERIRDAFKKVGVQAHFKGTNTLRNILVSPKDKDTKLSKQDVIYCVPCRDNSCDQIYIGETGRTLGERIKAHITDPNSAVKRHHMDTSHPLPDLLDNDIKIMGTESNAFKRKVKEAVYIKVNNPPLNQNIGQFNLPPIYDQLLVGGGGDKLLFSKR